MMSLQDRMMERSQSRFVALVDQTGAQVCAPVYVEFSELSYIVSDAEFEFRAIKLAVEDGLVSAEQRASVRANFASLARA
jgi:hypothetical protein